MKNFSVPGSYILGKTVLLDGLEGGFLTILLSWLYYDSFLAIPFLIPLIWFWHKERENVRREKRLQTAIRGTAAQMAEIMDTRREIRTLLAARVYEQRIMSVMPAAVLLYIRLGSGEFLEGLYHNMTGVLVMSVCLGIYGAAYLMGKRMVQFEI